MGKYIPQVIQRDGNRMINTPLQKLKTYGLKTFIYYTWLEIVKHLYWYTIRQSFSQNQEDLIIDKILGYKKNGFYVDVGAYDPDRFSNTKRFYLKGWTGINIEPDTLSYEKFLNKRPNDINLNIGISDNPGVLTYYKMEPQTLSTFVEDEAKEYIKQGYSLLEKKEVEVKSLAEVFDSYRANNPIDILSIDTEGLDMEVLKSNDWTKYKPQIICIESVKHLKIDRETPSVDMKDSDQQKYLSQYDYTKVFDNGLNSIYQLKANGEI